MDAVLEKTQELAEAIRSSDSFVKLKQCEQRMKNSAAAEKANAEYDSVFQQVRAVLHAGTAERSEAVRRLQKAREQRDACPEIADYLAASEQFRQMMDNVNQLLCLIVSDTLSDDSGKCSGNCSACSGCSR